MSTWFWSRNSRHWTEDCNHVIKEMVKRNMASNLLVIDSKYLEVFIEVIMHKIAQNWLVISSPFISGDQRG